MSAVGHGWGYSICSTIYTRMKCGKYQYTSINIQCQRPVTLWGETIIILYGHPLHRLSLFPSEAHMPTVYEDRCICTSFCIYTGTYIILMFTNGLGMAYVHTLFLLIPLGHYVVQSHRYLLKICLRLWSTFGLGWGGWGAYSKLVAQVIWLSLARNIHRERILFHSSLEPIAILQPGAWLGQDRLTPKWRP